MRNPGRALLYGVLGAAANCDHQIHALPQLIGKMGDCPLGRPTA